MLRLGEGGAASLRLCERARLLLGRAIRSFARSNTLPVRASERVFISDKVWFICMLRLGEE